MSWPRSALTELLGIEHPIIQAPMAGASNARLAAAVSNAGGLGGFGGTDTSPEDLRAVIRAIRERTIRPVIVHLYVDKGAPHVIPRESEEPLKPVLSPAHRALEAGAPPDSLDLLARADEQ